MKRAFSLGPFKTKAGEGYMLTLMDQDRPVVVETAATALDGLRVFVERYGADGFVASMELQDEARMLGVAIGQLPESVCEFRATQAWMLGNGNAISPTVGFGASSLLAALAGYVEASPWHWLNADTPLLVSYQERGRSGRGGERASILEVSVLGNAGEVLGLALYDRPGSIAKLSRRKHLQASDVVLLSLDDEPAWGVEAMRAGFGVPFFPRLSRIHRDQSRPLAEGDLRRLEAVLWATAQLDAVVGMVEGEYEDEDRDLHVSVSVEIVKRVENLNSVERPPVRDQPRAANATVSRNAACPCGSGRKYKRCCMVEQQARAAPTTRAGSPRNVSESLPDKLTSFMRREAPEHARQWIQALLGNAGMPERLMPVVIPLLLYELPLGEGETGETLASRFLVRRGSSLNANERRTLEASRAARFSVWEVIGVERGRGLELFDLLTGERCFVHEVSATRNMQVRAALLTRVVELGERRELDGLHPYPLAPAYADEVVAAVRRHGKARKQWIDREQLAGPQIPKLLFEQWQQQVELQHHRPEQLVELVNTDGDVAEQIFDRYELLDDPEQLFNLLLELPGAVDEDADEQDGAWLIGMIREGNAMHPTWLRTNIGTLAIRGSTLVLETNSQPRADALRRAVEARLGLFARFEGRRIESLRPIRRPGGGRLAIDSQPVSAWLATSPVVLHELQLRHWRHAANDKLDGQTPCEAAVNVASRRKLHALLRELEHGLADDGREAFARLRNELGLDLIGEHISAKQRDDVKISGRLLEFAMPLLMCSDDEEEGEAIMRVAAEVWTHVGVVGEHAVDRTKLLGIARNALVEHGLKVEDRRVQFWVNKLMLWRKLYDDPRLAQIVSVDRSPGRFNIIAAGLSPR